MRIETLERRRGRQFCMTLDDGREYMVDKQTMEESVYTVGSTLEEEALEHLLSASQTRRAREYALYLLSVRDYGERELCRKLREACLFPLFSDKHPQNRPLQLSL